MTIVPLKKPTPAKNHLPQTLSNGLPNALPNALLSSPPSPLPNSASLTQPGNIPPPTDNADLEPVCISQGFDRGRIIVLIDGSNLFYAALQLGIEIDYAKLLQCLTVNAQLVHAFFYTGVDPSNDKQQGFLSWMRHNGYRVVTKDMIQLADGSKKANLDVEIAVDMMRLAQYCDTIVLVSGDGDFAYAVKNLLYQGVRVEVLGLRSMTSNSLIDAADCYVDLNMLRGAIQRFDKLSIGTNPVSTSVPTNVSPNSSVL